MSCTVYCEGIQKILLYVDKAIQYDTGSCHVYKMTQLQLSVVLYRMNLLDCVISLSMIVKKTSITGSSCYYKMESSLHQSFMVFPIVNFSLNAYLQWDVNSSLF